MIYALIKNGVVIDRIIATTEFINSNFSLLKDPFSQESLDNAIDVTNLLVEIGFTYDGVNFYPRIENE